MGYCVAGLSGCGRGTSEISNAITVSDSVGASVVTVAPTVNSARWTVHDSAIFSIAPDTGDVASPLYFITGAHRFEDGSVVVASSGTSELRYFSSDGELIRVVGRKGDGPEEFGSLGFVRSLKDSLWVYDVTHSRFAVLDREGRFGLGDPGGERNYVVVRHGVIARIRDYMAGAAKSFLVDASIFPGNSGGPVVTRPDMVAIEGTKAPQSANLLGIVAGYVPYQDVAYSKQTNRPRVIFEENTGLAVVVPIDFAIETIERLELQRAAKPAPQPSS